MQRGETSPPPRRRGRALWPCATRGGVLHGVEGVRDGFREVSRGLHRPDDLAATAAADAVLDGLVDAMRDEAEPHIAAPSEMLSESVEGGGARETLGEDGITSEVLRHLPSHFQ